MLTIPEDAGSSGTGQLWPLGDAGRRERPAARRDAGAASSIERPPAPRAQSWIIPSAPFQTPRLPSPWRGRKRGATPSLARGRAEETGAENGAATRRPAAALGLLILPRGGPGFPRQASPPPPQGGGGLLLLPRSDRRSRSVEERLAHSSTISFVRTRKGSFLAGHWEMGIDSFRGSVPGVVYCFSTAAFPSACATAAAGKRVRTEWTPSFWLGSDASTCLCGGV